MLTGPNGISGNMPHVILVATNADSVYAPRDHAGQFVSERAHTLCVTLAAHYSTTFHIRPSPVVLDAHLAHSPGVKLLKSALQDVRTSLAQVSYKLGFI